MRHLLLAILFYLQSSICFAQLEFDEISKRDFISNSVAEYDFVFTFKNIGKIPIKIISIETTCGCTIATTNKMLIMPNDNGNIRGTLKLSDADTQTKNIIVNTDYLPQKSITLSLNINKIELLKISPRLLFWKKNLTLSEKTVTIKVLNRNISIAKISYDTKLIKLKRREGNSSDEFILDMTPLEINKVLRTRVCIHVKDTSDGSMTKFYIHILIK